MSDSIAKRLRECNDLESDDIDEAADMLEFFFGQMQMHSAKMDGQHSWRFRSGWPMTHCVGSDAQSAVRSAMQEVERSRREPGQ